MKPNQKKIISIHADEVNKMLCRADQTEPYKA